MPNGWGELSDAEKMKAAEQRALKQGATPERARQVGADSVNHRARDRAHPTPEEPAGDTHVNTAGPRLDDKSLAELALAASKRGIADVETLSKSQLIHAMRDLMRAEGDRDLG